MCTHETNSCLLVLVLFALCIYLYIYIYIYICTYIYIYYIYIYIYIYIYTYIPNFFFCFFVYCRMTSLEDFSLKIILEKKGSSSDNKI